MPRRRRSKLGGRQGLYGLAQAHVVGENHATPAGRENGAALLVGQQLRLEYSVQRITSLAKLCEKLAFQIEPVRELVFPVEILDHVAVKLPLPDRPCGRPPITS